MSLPAPLAGFAAYQGFINYRLAPKPKGGVDKLPIDAATGTVIDSQDQRYVKTYLEAAATGQPVALVIREGHGVFFIDLDHCLVNGQWMNGVAEICSMFPGAFVEVSSSGDGLHIIGRFAGELNHSCVRHADKLYGFKIELYTKGRFCALTMTGAQGDINTFHTEALTRFATANFPPKMAKVGEDDEWTDGPCEGWSGPDDDDVLIKKMIGSSSVAAAFGAKASFKDLWEAYAPTLALAWPPNENNASALYDESSADLAMANHLAFWTGGDCERMHRLMWKSKLVREKWEYHKNYLRNTIVNACNSTENYYNDKRNARPEIKIAEGIAPKTPDGSEDDREVGGHLFLDQQISYFAGCTYIEDINGVLVPDGSILNQAQFNARYAGHKFPTELDGSRPTAKAWDAFVMSTMYRFPKVRGSCFYPKMPPNQIITIDEQSFVNTWRPLKIAKVEGDITPFMKHLTTLYPQQRDREILLAYFAFIAQFPGTKAKWCPLLQGVEGNGKTFFSLAMQYCVGRRYTHWPKAAELDSKFNEALYGKLLICVEDVFTAERAAMFETLKPMITGEELEIEGKGIAKVTREICFNFILNTNHRDGVRKTANDRRIAPFFGAQQDKEHLRRDGLDSQYMLNLFHWAKHENGFAIIADYLSKYQIPAELNPGGLCNIAPETSSTREAIMYSMGGVEQEIMSAIEQQQQGFSGGWVSAYHITLLLRRLNKENSIPPRKRDELMYALGYDWHPNLPGGVPTQQVPGEGRPKLYLARDHLARNLTQSPAIIRAYMEAQQKTIDMNYNVPPPPGIDGSVNQA